MHDIFSEKITKFMLEKKIINQEDAELYAFGFHDAVMLVLTMLPAVIFSAFLGMAWQAILYFFAFLPLRLYGGGYHASTEFRCYITSVLQIVLVMLIVKYLPWIPALNILLLLFAGLVIWVVSPLEHENKPLSTAEFSAYRHRVRLFLLGESIVIIIAAIPHWQTVATTVLMAPVSLCVSLLLAKGQALFASKTIINK